MQQLRLNRTFHLDLHEVDLAGEETGNSVHSASFRILPGGDFSSSTAKEPMISSTGSASTNSTVSFSMTEDNNSSTSALTAGDPAKLRESPAITPSTASTTDGDSSSAVETGLSHATTVGLAVGFAVGTPVLLIAIVLAIFLVCNSRRRGATKTGKCKDVAVEVRKQNDEHTYGSPGIKVGSKHEGFSPQSAKTGVQHESNAMYC